MAGFLKKAAGALPASPFGKVNLFGKRAEAVSVEEQLNGLLEAVQVAVGELSGLQVGGEYCK